MNLLQSSWETLKIKLLSLYDHPVEPQFMELHSTMPHYVLWYLRGGGLDFRADDGFRITLCRNSWILIPPGLGRRHAFRPGTPILSCHFVAEWPGGRPFFGLSSFCADQKGRWNSLLPLLERIYEDQQEYHSPITLKEQGERGLRIRELIHDLTAVLQQAGVPASPPVISDSRLQSVCAILDRLPYVGRIPYGELTRACSLSRVQLDRVFAAAFRITPKHYLARKCLQAANEMLMQSSTPVKEVAYRLGFSGSAHFCRWFCRQTGYSPQEYRALYIRHSC